MLRAGSQTAPWTACGRLYKPRLSPRHARCEPPKNELPALPCQTRRCKLQQKKDTWVVGASACTPHIAVPSGPTAAAAIANQTPIARQPLAPSVFGSVMQSWSGRRDLYPPTSLTALQLLSQSAGAGLSFCLERAQWAPFTDGTIASSGVLSVLSQRAWRAAAIIVQGRSGRDQRCVAAAVRSSYSCRHGLWMGTLMNVASHNGRCRI